LSYGFRPDPVEEKADKEADAAALVKQANSLKSQKPFYRVRDLLWPVMWNYFLSIAQAMASPPSRVLCALSDDVWLSKVETFKQMVFDPVRGMAGLMPDQVPIGRRIPLYVRLGKHKT
jgi:hypothetical protein